MKLTAASLQKEILPQDELSDFTQSFKKISCSFAEPEWDIQLYESVFASPKVFLLEWNEQFSSPFCASLSKKLQSINQDCVQKQDERQCILSMLGRLLTFYLLQKVYGIQKPKIQWEGTKKPFLLESPLSFNISHSGNLCVCAFSNTPIGVDIQYMENKRILQLAKRFFLQQEYELLTDCSLDERKQLFYWLWTRKESYLKSKGEGLSFLLKDVNYASKTFSSIVLKEYILSLCW